MTLKQRILKNKEAVVEHFRSRYLTKKESNVLYYCLLGLKHEEVARKFKLQESTIKSHKHTGMKKLKLKKTSDLIYLIEEFFNA